MKYFILLFVAFVAFLPIQVNATSPKMPKTKTVSIHTSAVCDQCSGFINTALKKVKGVKVVKVNLETQMVDVTYRIGKTDDAAIRKAISKAGYDADDVPAEQEAYDNLPRCCRKGGHD